jgi:molybdenum-dependent DNA-binding transcriptional regulator ModE
MNKSRKKEAKRLSEELKEELLKRFKNKEPLRKISKELKISYLTIWNYYQKFKSSLPVESTKEEILKRLDKIEALLMDLCERLKESEIKKIKKRLDLNLDINQELKNPEEEWISVKEASKILNISERQIQRYIQKGLFKAVKKKDMGLKGKGFLILKKEVEDIKKT